MRGLSCVWGAREFPFHLDRFANMTTEPPVDQQTADAARARLQGLVDEIAQLCRADVPPDVFYAEFLQRVVSALAWRSRAFRYISEASSRRLRRS